MKKLVGVRYINRNKELSKREYTYYTDTLLEDGDLVNCPTVHGDVVGLVTVLDVPEDKIEGFKDKVKTITHKASIIYNDTGTIKGFEKLEGGQENR